MSRDGTGTAGQVQDRPSTRLTPNLQFLPRHAVLDPCSQSLGTRFFGRKARRKALGSGSFGAAIRNFLVGKHPAQEAVAEALDRACDARYFNQIDARAHQHDATLAQPEIFSRRLRKTQLMRCFRLSDGWGVQPIPGQNRAEKGWDLNLIALCPDDAARTVRFLTGAVMACGGCVLSRRFDAGETASIEFEFVRATCVEMYSILIAAGLELSAQSHMTLATLCQCTRETLETTAADPVRIEITIRKSGVASRCNTGGCCTPPKMA